MEKLTDVDKLAILIKSEFDRITDWIDDTNLSLVDIKDDIEYIKDKIMELRK